MISKTNWLVSSASIKELGWFAAMSVLVAGLFAAVGLAAMEAVPELVGSRPGLTEAYIGKALHVLSLVAFLAVAGLMAAKNYRLLQHTVARCELAEDEMAWIKRYPEYGQMIEDRELMRLTTNVRRVCRTYEARNPLFVRFLEEYRVLLEHYGWGMEKTRQARIQHMNEAADEGLERNARRIEREHQHKGERRQ